MDDANAEQRRYWSEGPGQHWVRDQAIFDAHLASALDALMAAADPAPGSRVLDIGCGPGASTLHAAETVGPDGSVTGADISEPLVDFARSRAAEAGLSNVEFLVADAQTGELGGPYDLALSRFGVMFFADTGAAFANIRAALAPGGRFVFVAWDGPSMNPLFRLPAEAVVRHVGPPAVPPDPDAPGPMRFANSARVVTWLEAAGFHDVSVATRALRLGFPGRAADVAAFAMRVGPAVRLLEEKNATDRAAEVAETLVELVRQWEAGDETLIPASVHVFSATA